MAGTILQSMIEMYESGSKPQHQIPEKTPSGHQLLKQQNIFDEQTDDASSRE